MATPLLSTSLQQLLTTWLVVDIKEVNLTGINLDSRQIVEGDLFVALQGALLDGRIFIDKAISQGAVAVLSETTIESQHGAITYKGNVPIIEFYQLSTILSALAYAFYFPHHDLHKVIAVTGTNGKTTIATLLANCFTLLGKRCAQMGTIGNGVFGQLKSSLNTTLDGISVFSELFDYQIQHQVDYTVMEVSSHGLSQGRVKALPFHSAIFTNLSRDHLDYHGTMACYADAKKRLFKEFPLNHRIINGDDETGIDWIKEFPDAVVYGQNAQQQASTFLQINHIAYQAKGILFSFDSSWGAGDISAPFYGDFNVYNLAAVATQLLLEGISTQQLTDIFPQLTCVPGRMEQYHFDDADITFVVDYAHTPDALEKALSALQKHKDKGRVICAFGCGGDRDKGKRPEMAIIAELFAEMVVLVDDNPRTESAEAIMQDILVGFKRPDAVVKINDRKEAVMHLLATCQPGDIILLAGKGHEDYQIIGETRIHYSDRELLTTLQAQYNKKDKEACL
ncbi:UDP-N-acetylmuramoyl-L-alanyl-D-glutamate--2,6-diaminopimelate ligase [Psychromonas sp. PT13]|uniref:UDP-N-acetylmuramoyl-L-alanyl-D-glutamate--2, 6-diaminopimelate ligase n=1 Tax=Psychromonas sp. PT13 TaxID=3439547 RepID=UPI003EB91337